MIDFTVVYKHPVFDKYIISRVYAIDGSNFLITDENGKFEWVHMDYCTKE